MTWLDGPVDGEQWRITHPRDLTGSDQDQLANNLGLAFLWANQPEEFVIGCRVLTSEGSEATVLEVTRRNGPGVDFILSTSLPPDAVLNADLHDQVTRALRGLLSSPADDRR